MTPQPDPSSSGARSRVVLALVAATFVISASFGLNMPLLPPLIEAYWVSRAAGPAQGAQLGRQTAAAGLGQAAGSAFAGVAFASVAPSGAALWAGAAVVLAATLLAATVRLRPRTTDRPDVLAQPE